jgi:transposase
MATLSLDLRERIIKAYDKGDATRNQIAQRFDVSLGMVKKLVLQRRVTGCIKPRHHLAGRKKLIVAEHRIAIRQLLKRKPDLTLAELREKLGLNCSLPAIHYVLADMGLTYKKKRSAQQSKTARTSAVRGGVGSVSKVASNPGGSSFSMKAGLKPT